MIEFIQSGNTMTSVDGRYLIERHEDHRGRTYACWDTRPSIDWGWLFIGTTDNSVLAKKSIDLAHRYGGTA